MKFYWLSLPQALKGTKERVFDDTEFSKKMGQGFITCPL